MGRKAKKRKQKLWQQASPGTTIIFLAKDHYSEEWPDTWFKVHTGGIFPVDINGTEVSILGHWFTVYAGGRELEGIYGIRIFRPGEPGSRGVYFHANLPTRAADLAPYGGYVEGMIRDMVRNGAIPSWDDLCRYAVEQDVMEAPPVEVG